MAQSRNLPKITPNDSSRVSPKLLLRANHLQLTQALQTYRVPIVSYTRAKNMAHYLYMTTSNATGLSSCEFCDSRTRIAPIPHGRGCTEDAINLPQPLARLSTLSHRTVDNNKLANDTGRGMQQRRQLNLIIIYYSISARRRAEFNFFAPIPHDNVYNLFVPSYRLRC